MYVSMHLFMCARVTELKERERERGGVCFFGRLTSQQHASVGSAQTILRAATLTEVADQTLHLTQSQYTDTGPTSPRTDPITPDAWQGSHRSANV